MEINNDKKIQINWYAEKADREARMPKKEVKPSRGDDVEISNRVPKNLKQAPEVRREKVDKARENIAAGRYQKPDVLGEIVNRLIEQFGL